VEAGRPTEALVDVETAGPAELATAEAVGEAAD